MNHTLIKQLAQELNASIAYTTISIELLDGGATVPFIARYRKEVTGGMTDEQLRLLEERLPYLRELEERRQSILLEIQTQGQLTDALSNAILQASTKQRLEDIYAPFKPKRRTRAMIAKEAGLEPLAFMLLNDRTLDPNVASVAFIDTDKNIATIKDALNGAKDILSEQFAETADVVTTLRDSLWSQGHLYSTLIEVKVNNQDTNTNQHQDNSNNNNTYQPHIKHHAKNNEQDKYQDYFQFNEALETAPSHRVLAMLRGQAQNVLKLQCEIPAYYELIHFNHNSNNNDNSNLIKNTIHPLQIRLATLLNLNNLGQNPAYKADLFLNDCVHWTWRVKLQPGLETDCLTQLKDKTHLEAVKVFANNVKDVLLAPPMGQSVVMGLDPGFRTGVKVAVISETGAVLETGIVYPFEPKKDEQGTLATLRLLIERHQVNTIAIGNGTASRETDALVCALIKTLNNNDNNNNIHNKVDHKLYNLKKVVVSEAGASVYSASSLASQELPDLDVSLRGAVSIARRLQDPLAELVKIDPKSIGVGQYQHDLPARQLAHSLNAVVEDCVNSVGVDVNTASPALLERVSGLTPALAKAIVSYREINGAFHNRQTLKKVSRLGDKAFEQCAGFLRIQGRYADNPLDNSSVHPESYPLVQAILNHLNQPIERVIGQRALLSQIVAEQFITADYGLPTINDVITELEKPGRDPRGTFQYAQFNDDIQSINDVYEGLILEGVVSNVAAFGAFVDIGVHQDGLVHVSELTDGFVKDPRTVVKAGQTVKVRVLNVDVARKRITLSMKLNPPIHNTSQLKPLKPINTQINNNINNINNNYAHKKSNVSSKVINNAFSEALLSALKK